MMLVREGLIGLLVMTVRIGKYWVRLLLRTLGVLFLVAYV